MTYSRDTIQYMSRTWRPAAGYEEYLEVSSDGYVKFIPRLVNRSAHPYVTKERVTKGSVRKDGYCRVFLKRKTLYVHRLVLETFSGPAPTKTHVVMHKDDDPRNNDISNLSWGTQEENVLDMIRKGRFSHWSSVKDTCKNGHKFTNENTYIRPTGHRRCRVCQREYERKHRKK